MSHPSSNPPYTSSKSTKGTRGQVTQNSHPAFPHGGPQEKPASPPPAKFGPGQPNSRTSTASVSSRASTTDTSSMRDEPFPKATATRRDKLVGNVEKVIISKITRDPELCEQGTLRAVGGKALADGLAMVDSNTLRSAS
ncbi:hypothetical protein CTheo_7041 [Ceratobasidium theobromae]|uniref:Uncharacterized protein n=1 Tax=Ceratobasidium theobromae TaxID=1582974 RepID=A0A5N5QD42_9AGAM|nr:hypothetical protein CTheo_7041 [Ceratobasidium theobromae]